jgi:hypothetical protein
LPQIAREEADHKPASLPKLDVLAVDELFGLLNGPRITFANNCEETTDAIFVVQKIDPIFHLPDANHCSLPVLAFSLTSGLKTSKADPGSSPVPDMKKYTYIARATDGPGSPEQQIGPAGACTDWTDAAQDFSRRWNVTE